MKTEKLPKSSERWGPIPYGLFFMAVYMVLAASHCAISLCECAEAKAIGAREISSIGASSAYIAASGWYCAFYMGRIREEHDDSTSEDKAEGDE